MLASAGSTTNRSMSLSLVILPVAADPNRMILSGRATVRTRRTTSFSSVSSTFIQFHHTQSRLQLHETTSSRDLVSGRETAIAKNARLRAVGENRPDEDPAFKQGHRDGQVGIVHIHATLGVHRDGSRLRIDDPELRGSGPGQGSHRSEERR